MDRLRTGNGIPTPQVHNQWSQLESPSNPSVDSSPEEPGQVSERTLSSPNKPYYISPNSKITEATAKKYLGQYRDRVVRNHYATKFINLPKNTIAIICAHNQPFWVIDMKENPIFQKANVPYLIASPLCNANHNNSFELAHQKGIRRDTQTIFGRDHEFGQRFYDTYDSNIQGSHFRVDCDRNGNLSVTDLWTYGDTRLITETPAPSRTKHHAFDRDYYNSYTPQFVNEGRMHLRANQNPSTLSDVFKERHYDNKFTVTIGGLEYPAIDRDATTFNGAIDVGTGGPDDPDIFLDADSTVIKIAYDRLLGKLSQRRRLDKDELKNIFQSKYMRILKAVYDTVTEMLPYDKSETTQTSRWNSRAYPEGELVNLSDFVRNSCGVCRHQTLLGVCLLEKLRNDGYITGTIHAERNMNDLDDNGKRGGHEWITFQESPNKPVYVIDVAQEVLRKKESATNWDYQLYDPTNRPRRH